MRKAIGEGPLEPITKDIAVEKIAQSLERVTSTEDRMKAIQEAVEKALKMKVQFVL